jgi:hypothetical protein
MKKASPNRTSLLPDNKDSKINAIKQLKALFIADLKKRCPLVPDFALCTPDYKDTTSNGLTRCVIDYIKLLGYHVERTGNEGRVIDSRQTYKDVLGYSKTIGKITRIKSSGTAGTSDIKAIVQSKFIAIEIKCKATGDRIRPEQLRYRHQIEQSGGLYVIATTFQQFYDWLNETFVVEVEK